MHGFRPQIWTKFRSRSCRLRRFSTEFRFRARTVEVPIGGNGVVRLDLLAPRHAESTKPHILIYLPPGTSGTGTLQNGSPEGLETPTLLSSLLPNTTIITLNYRLCPPTRVFPLPIHDAALAFNYILRNLVHHASPQISLLGSRIGGTLATTLALTSPNSIHSVAVSEAILDWVSLAPGIGNDAGKPIATKSKTKPNQYTSTDAKSLLSLRSKLFPRPDNYFDPFASPTLFLRAPGRDCPQPYSVPQEAADGGASGPFEHVNHPHLSHSSPGSSSSDGEDAAASSLIRRRKVLRRWPPHGPPEDVQLPHFRAFLGDAEEGEGMVLRHQGEELVDLMRRVCFYGKGREVAEGRVGLEVLKGKNYDDRGGSAGLQPGLEEGARWLAQNCRDDA